MFHTVSIDDKIYADLKKVIIIIIMIIIHQIHSTLSD